MSLRQSVSLEGLLRLLCDLLPSVYGDSTKAVNFLKIVYSSREYLSDLFVLQKVIPRTVSLLQIDDSCVAVLACRTLLCVLQSLFSIPVAYRRLGIDSIYPTLVNICKMSTCTALLATVAEILFNLDSSLRLHCIITCFSMNVSQDAMVIDEIERYSEIGRGFMYEIVTVLLENEEPRVSSAIIVQFSQLAGALGLEMSLQVARTHFASIMLLQVFEIIPGSSYITIND